MLATLSITAHNAKKSTTRELPSTSTHMIEVATLLVTNMAWYTLNTIRHVDLAMKTVKENVYLISLNMTTIAIINVQIKL